LVKGLHIGTGVLAGMALRGTAACDEVLGREFPATAAATTKVKAMTRMENFIISS